MEYTVTLDAKTLSLKGLKCPRISIEAHDGNEFISAFYEKMYLIAEARKIVNAELKHFLRLRTGNDSPLEDMHKWAEE